MKNKRQLLCCAVALMALLLSACSPAVTEKDPSLDGATTTATQSGEAAEDGIEWDEPDDTSGSQSGTGAFVASGTKTAEKQSGTGTTATGTTKETVAGTSKDGANGGTTSSVMQGVTNGTTTTMATATTTTSVTTAAPIDNDGYGPIVKP